MNSEQSGDEAGSSGIGTADAPRVQERKLEVGERGYVFDHGYYWPARVLANDVIQTFGPIDCIIAYEKVGEVAGHEFTTRMAGRVNSCTGLRWVSNGKYAEIERAAIAKEREALAGRELRIPNDLREREA